MILADDHAVVRTGLRLVLELEPGLEVVDEVGDVASARRALAEHHPDVLILDLNMPGEPSLPAIEGLLRAAPGVRIVVLTMQTDPAFARQALRAGALGYVVKEAADAELVQAIHMAHRGRTYLSPELGARLAAGDGAGGGGELTEREREVLRLIALGHTNAEIATRLHLSVRTVETHRAHIQRKLRRSTRAELVRYAIDHGLVDLEPQQLN